MKIIDNINSLWGDDLKATIKSGSKLKIAASSFSIYAYEALKEELSKVESLEFIFTQPTFVTDKATDKFSKEHREFFIPKQIREKSLYGTEFEILLKNKLTQKAIAKECADWIRSKATFLSILSNAPMQQFACVSDKQTDNVYIPLNGFTAVDLGYQRGNAISNMINKFDGAQDTAAYLQLFEQIWNDKEKLSDVTDNICQHIESVYEENSPEKIYFLMLYNIFSEFLEDLDQDVLPNDKTGYLESVIWQKLFNFQRDAATGLINKLEQYNGCILADSVGLGKTFTALAVIKYYELRNRTVLVLCPKKISDNWQTYRSNYKTNILAKDRLNYDLLFHTDLSRTRGKSMGQDLSKINWSNYDLIVIDESHNFRNSGRNLHDKESRYERLMRTVIKEGVKTKVLLLSATPVNNRFNDLRNQLALAYEGESVHLQNKLKSSKGIEEIFRQAQKAFNTWSNLPAEERTATAILDALDFGFFELLDAVTIARSRKHIETFYDTADIGKFPDRRKPISHRLPLTYRDDILSINEIYKHLKEIKQSVYAPMSYVFPSKRHKYEEEYDTKTHGGSFKQVDRESALQTLMTINLLKRLESSVEAFRLTLKNLENRISSTIDAIDQFSNNGNGKALFPDIDDPLFDDDDELDSGIFSTEGKVEIDFADMDLISWRRDLEEDHTLILLLRENMEKITVEDDAKFQHLQEQVLNKIANPINPDNKKILIFTAFTDTANYLYKNLKGILKTNNIECGMVTGSDTPKTTIGQGFDFQKLLTFFSPISKEKELIFPNQPEEIDILIGTDCISEGQNLQDCDYLINYDIHWNPVRIIQRFGRIDRIGSHNDTIQLVNYLPDISLDDYINLKERVENKMHIVDITASGDDNVLSAKSNDISYRKEQLRKLQDEVIEMEDLKTGVNITDLGLNDFRMDLLNYIKEHGDMGNIPNGLHAVIPENPELNLKSGVIFTLRNRNAESIINQHNLLHPYHLIYMTNDGEVIMDNLQVKKMLDLVRSSCKNVDQTVVHACRKFNSNTDDGKNMSFYSQLLDKTISSMIDTQEAHFEDDLFADTSQSAFTDSFDGLDDFELISFIAVVEA